MTPGPDTPARPGAHGIREAADQRKVLEALPQLWAAAARAMRTEASDTKAGSVHPSYGYGYADAMDNCIRQLSDVLLSDADIFQLARGLLARYMHPSRLGHVPSVSENVVQIETDTALALFARRAHEQALLDTLDYPPQDELAAALEDQQAALREASAGLRSLRKKEET